MINTIQTNFLVDLMKVARDSPSMNDEELAEAAQLWTSHNKLLVLNSADLTEQALLNLSTVQKP